MSSDPALLDLRLGHSVLLWVDFVAMVLPVSRHMQCVRVWKPSSETECMLLMCVESEWASACGCAASEWASACGCVESEWASASIGW